MKILELAGCPACGASVYRTFDLGNGNVLRRCSACDTVSALRYADPAEVYVDGYLFGAAGGFGIDVRQPGFQEYLMGVAAQRLRLIERSTRIRGGSLLDVGSGTGEVLMAARDRGWQTQGVEPERTAAEMALGRGLDVTISTLEQSGLPEASFDVVSAFHVLEHIPDSRGFLRTLARWARPGGYVVVEVPNFASLQRRTLADRWPDLRPLEHLVHFTPRTLKATFEAAGLEPRAARSPAYIGPPQSLDYALGDLARPHGRLRRLLEPLSPIRDTGAGPARYPNRAGWALLHVAETFHDRAGLGSVVFCVGRVSGARDA